jgi:uncharacterized protein YutE (UPF0331/DUF86 family)
MTAYDSQIVAKRLAHLEEVTAKLEKEKPLTIEDLSSSDMLSDATLYRIQTGIEAIVDIGGHILAEIYKKHPDTYKDTLKELSKEGIVSKDLIEENMTMVDFRNILVHHYVDLDPEKALVNIHKAPGAFRQFAEEITVFLEKQNSSS